MNWGHWASIPFDSVLCLHRLLHHWCKLSFECLIWASLESPRLCKNLIYGWKITLKAFVLVSYISVLSRSSSHHSSKSAWRCLWKAKMGSQYKSYSLSKSLWKSLHLCTRGYSCLSMPAAGRWSSLLSGVLFPQLTPCSISSSCAGPRGTRLQCQSSKNSINIIVILQVFQVELPCGRPVLLGWQLHALHLWFAILFGSLESLPAWRWSTLIDQLASRPVWIWKIW